MRTYFALIAAFCILSVSLLIGCISAQQELARPDAIFIETTPEGAKVLLDNNFADVTPASIQLTRSALPHNIKIVKEGYQTEEFTLAPKVEEVNVQRKSMVINSTALFGAFGLVAGFAGGVPLKGLLGGSVLGLAVGQLQKKDELTIRYEYSPKSMHINLTPLLDK